MSTLTAASTKSGASLHILDEKQDPLEYEHVEHVEHVVDEHVVSLLESWTRAPVTNVLEKG